MSPRPRDSLEDSGPSLGALLVLFRRGAARPDGPCTGTAPRAGSIRPPMAAMTAWITGESACRAPLGRPKPADAAAFPWATVALTTLAPSIRLKARRFPPASHTATLSLT